jgi:oxygen-independent coproporphyrinogen-3 oxidase
MRLMCDRRLDFATLSADLGLDFQISYNTELASLAPLLADEVVALDDTSLRVTARGTPLLRIVAQHFDAYAAAGDKRHSQAV